jgi:hypothetical protein
MAGGADRKHAILPCRSRGFDEGTTAALESRVRSVPTDGPVAQLGARLNGIQEVTGSIPVRSTSLRSRVDESKRELRLGKPPKAAAPKPKGRRRAPAVPRIHRSSAFRLLYGEPAYAREVGAAPTAASLAAGRRIRCRQGGRRSCDYLARETLRVRAPKHRGVAARLRWRHRRRGAQTERTQRRPVLAHRDVPALAAARRHRVLDKDAAITFERFLKSGSGRAFAKRHFG